MEGLSNTARLSFLVSLAGTVLISIAGMRLLASAPPWLTWPGMGLVGIAIYMTAVGVILRSDPRIWRRSSAFWQRVAPEMPGTSDEELEAFRDDVSATIAWFGGLSFGFGAAAAVAHVSIVGAVAAAGLSAFVVGRLLVLWWERQPVSR